MRRICFWITMRRIVISGTLVKGLGRGRYFMRQKEYTRQFVGKLGINPYHGTLNVKISNANARKLAVIKRVGSIRIRGFRRGKSNFGGALCYRAVVSGIKCALVIPERTSHKGIVEIISSTMLRRKLGLKDGDRVRITLLL